MILAASTEDDSELFVASIDGDIEEGNIVR